jgi:hypothetical protein
MADTAQHIAALILGPNLSCIAAVPGKAGVHVSVGGLAERHRDGVRIWLKTRRQADQVLIELLSWRAAAQRGEGLLIAADITPVSERLYEAAELLGFPISEDHQVETALSNLERRIQEALDGGTAKLLGRQYRKLRMAGEPVPSYPDWLLGRLRSVLSRGIDLGFAWEFAGSLSV